MPTPTESRKIILPKVNALLGCFVPKKLAMNKAVFGKG